MVTLPVAAEIAPTPKWSPASAGQTDEQLVDELRREKEAEEEKACEAAQALEARRKTERAARAQRELEAEEARELQRQAAVVKAEAEAAQRARKAGAKEVVAAPTANVFDTIEPDVRSSAPPPKRAPEQPQTCTGQEGGLLHTLLLHFSARLKDPHQILSRKSV